VPEAEQEEIKAIRERNCRAKTADYLAWGAVISELVSARLFPVLRENTGKFVDSSLKRTIIRSIRSANSMAYQRISLSGQNRENFRVIRQ
jgi:hypothetical protein